MGATVDENITAVGIVEAAHEVRDGRLARSGLTDEGDDLSGFDAEGHVLERACERPL